MRYNFIQDLKELAELPEKLKEAERKIGVMRAKLINISRVARQERAADPDSDDMMNFQSAADGTKVVFVNNNHVLREAVIKELDRKLA